ncbi:lysozyme inhibitor LprI family protein [Rhizobiaceae bacterium BDR2-2]|uniref:Lysozyme inhibitor LprI family protein n=1 Tax=Ectorhizobium quercum TaxID=2965071 RepID=A0AAE3N2P2_9HYPH|nr:lysozyme inhibitor LprI family protein [Ectorhizobium quercum]MCX8999733.1 lysozyme inhibitor LprI family protein [Ectorhizobium quercum]
MKRILLTTALASFTLSVAHADECMDKAEDQTTMNNCALQAYQASDAELNRLFHEIRKRLGDDPDKRQLLRGAERTWVAFRDAECDFTASAVTGGSAYPMVYDMCLNDLTQQRIRQFQQYLACEEGDMSCPVPSAN